MSALYVLKLADCPGRCVGAVYIGRGVVVGADIAGVKYEGTVETLDEGFRLRVTARAPAGGAILASGRLFPSDENSTVSGILPRDFENGAPFEVSFLGAPIFVSLEKVGDVP